MKNPLIIKHAQKLLCPTDFHGGFGQLDIIEDGAVVCRKDIIVWVGKTSDIPPDYENENCQVINASNKLVAPGFVDCHTHPIFSGTREHEFVMRCQGKSYREIAEAGGGIRYSVRMLRTASEEELLIDAIPRLNRFLSTGTTTIEAKSGYGLSIDNEIKMLRVIRKLNEIHPIDIVPTFLGAHELPDEYRDRRRDYIDLVIHEMIPMVAEEKLAVFCDVFCEDHVFTVNESEEILQAALNAGLKIKIHADQLTSSHGAAMAASLGAVSADHLDYSDSNTVEQLKQHGVIPVLLPGAVFFLGLSHYANARSMIDSQLPVAIATDFNPGSCTIQSMPLIASISCIYMHMTPTETWIASTINAAKSVCLEQKIGSLSVNKQADIIIWDIPNENFMPYSFGNTSIDNVVKNGDLLKT